MSRTILVTGIAGFIGFHVGQALLARGDRVIGIDNINDYYDVQLKQARLNQLVAHPNFTFIKLDIADQQAMHELFMHENFDVVVHLAAQAGVRYSITNPLVYVHSNLVGFGNILEGCRQQKARHSFKHLIFASSSSVYGARVTPQTTAMSSTLSLQPFSEHDAIDHPCSFYAATKKANEAMAHSYASLYQIPCTGIRYFTVYGPWGRPDMALFRFTESILAGQPIEVYGNGTLWRDFTYIDDAVTATLRLIDQPAQANLQWSVETSDPASSYAPYRIYNVGNNQPTILTTLIAELEQALGQKAITRLLPMQPGDVAATAADTSYLVDAIGPLTATKLKVGIRNFVDWYQSYYVTN